jgi:hypothetical protein
MRRTTGLNRLLIVLIPVTSWVLAARPVQAQTGSGVLRGVARAPDGSPQSAVSITVHSIEQNGDQTALTGADGQFIVENLTPGVYELRAGKQGFVSPPAKTVAVAPGESLDIELTVQMSDLPPRTQKKFLDRLAQAYLDDWKGSGESGAAPAFRGYPAPESNPPYPFTVWPYGGSPVLGQPDSSPPPLTTALWAGSKAWEQSRVKIYGWVNYGSNLSTSSQKNGLYANAPAAYAEIPNSVQLDQVTLYLERVPDTVQKDHFDWGFRFTNLYGMDYRFTTAKGYFSSQLIDKNNTYGYDPVMFYADLYFPKVADGMNLRVGRYISLPDIEAQLAPNNYTYTHSLTYVYDCYTQTGANATISLSKHLMVQAGFSAGCEAAPWTPDAKPTYNWCVSYTWSEGGDNVYLCDNATNDGNYAYNNLQAYYLTWYHKFNQNWHTGTEYWYQWENKVPNVTNPAAASLLEAGANGAVCSAAADLTCYAPATAIVNYLNRQLSKKDFVSLRNEFFNDMTGQRTGFKTRYTEHGLSYNHWIGSTILFRPELRYEHAYDSPAYNGGTSRSQFMFAGDFIFFY